MGVNSNGQEGGVGFKWDREMGRGEGNGLKCLRREEREIKGRVWEAIEMGRKEGWV